jgi:hypothetical protein
MRISILICSALLLAAAVYAGDLSSIYDMAELNKWQQRYPENIQWNFDNLIWPNLIASEKQNIGDVRLFFSIFAPGEGRGDPLAYYAQSSSITLPIFSIKFFDDLAIAYAWLDAHGYDLNAVGDYVSMLKYKRRGDFPYERYPGPLQALGIPDDALENSLVDSNSQKILKSAIVWILAHELGHIYHSHPGYGPDVTSEEAQNNETEADLFATEIMRRIGIAPAGMVYFFTAAIHWSRNLGDFDNQSSWENYWKSVSTHPVTSDRLMGIARLLRENAVYFTKYETNETSAVQRVLMMAENIDSIAVILDDPDIQRSIRIKGLATTTETLQPRYPGDPLATGSEEEHSSSLETTPFHGEFQGEYMHYVTGGRKEWLSGKMVLNRNNIYANGRFGFGLGEGKITGIVDNGSLIFTWEWAGSSGKGKLEIANAQGDLIGTWGYKESHSDGGAWDLRRK